MNKEEERAYKKAYILKVREAERERREAVERERVEELKKKGWKDLVGYKADLEREYQKRSKGSGASVMSEVLGIKGEGEERSAAYRRRRWRYLREKEESGTILEGEIEEKAKYEEEMKGYRREVNREYRKRKAEGGVIRGYKSLGNVSLSEYNRERARVRKEKEREERALREAEEERKEEEARKRKEARVEKEEERIESGYDHIAKALSSWGGYIGFKDTEVTEVLKRLSHQTIAVFSGNRGGKCLTYKTLIDTPHGRVSIGELYERNKSFEVFAWDGRKKVIAKADAPFKKSGLHKCYRLEMSNGEWVEMADRHTILTSCGWITSSDLHDTYLHNLLDSNLVFSRSIHEKGVSHLSQTRLNFQDHYSENFHQYDEPLLLDLDNVQVFFPLRDGVREHVFVLYNEDGLGNIYNDNLLTSLFHLSNLGVGRRLLARFFGVLYDSFYNIFLPFLRSYSTSALQFSTEVYDLPLNNANHLHQRVFFSYDNSPCLNVVNKVFSFYPIGCQEVFDFTVEKYHNYFAGGLIHHNTSSVAHSYVQRLLGIHPIGEKNRLMRKVRCMSSTLPESSGQDEGDNAQYIELKKLIPYELIEKDVNSVSRNLIVRRPVGMSSSKTVFEFRSSKQEMQDLGKIDISSLWHDEETPKDKREECRMRLMSERGDEFFTLTMTNPLSYVFGEIWERAGFIYRTKIISDRFGLPQVEHRKSGRNSACILMATDNNPILTLEDIDMIFEGIEDPDVLALRRYSVFKQISGRIHKAYNPSICYISYDKYFRDGIPMGWMHGRGIDYHESRVPWSIGWLSASPNNEWFLWKEFHPAIDGAKAYNTYDIARSIARKSGDYYFAINLIDPLANKKQPNTLFSATDDLNRYMDEIRKTEGMGTPAFWQGWDTKGTNGRDEVARRFKNAVRCGRPFNNAVKEHGVTKHIPTLWICDTCPEFHRSIMNWSFGEWASITTRSTNAPKVTAQQKYSHDNMVLEAFAKDQRFLFADHFLSHRMPHDTYKSVSITGR